MCRTAKLRLQGVSLFPRGPHGLVGLVVAGLSGGFQFEVGFAVPGFRIVLFGSKALGLQGCRLEGHESRS